LKPALTAVVTTLNEEANIRECLESLAFADRILLVDSFSKDRTVEIARSFPTATVVQREYFGSAAQKNWAMDQIETPWLLIVDADERVPEPLAREIRALLDRGAERARLRTAAPELLPRPRDRALGWSTDRVVRLLSADAARYPQRRVHADLTPEGPTPTLVEPLIHHTCRSLDQYLEKVERYAVWGAADASAPAGARARSSSCSGRSGASFACTSSRPGSSTGATAWCCAGCRPGACSSSGHASGSGKRRRGRDDSPICRSTMRAGRRR
jgi:hypothetical protein